MIERAVGSAVATADTREDVAESTLFPEEALLVVKAVPRRRAEFATVRHCARRALRLLGVPAVPILGGPRGEPRWPDGVVGSMTHCEGYRAAAVAREGVVAALGIDAEPDLPLPPGVRRVVLRAEEHEEVERCRALDPTVSWDRLVFSAKESVYKTWYPLMRRWLDFDEVSVGFDLENRAFTARFVGPSLKVGTHLREGLVGAFSASDKLLVTGLTVRR